jgi:hypothetical protein
MKSHRQPRGERHGGDRLGAEASTTGRSGIGERMLLDALRATPAEALIAVAKGKAIDEAIHRALMELAREELSRRDRGS